MHEDGRDAALELQQCGSDHCQDLSSRAMKRADPLEDGGVGQGELVREMSSLDALLGGLDFAQC